MTDRPLLPALNGTEQRLDRLIQKVETLVTLLTPVAPVEPDTSQIELKEPDAKPGKRK